PQRLGAASWLIEVVPAQDPFAERSRALVRRVRALPGVSVGGDSAGFVDQVESIESHTPAALALASAATLFVVFLMTGSVVLPVKQLLLNAMTVVATFGVLVWIFQHGRLHWLLDYEDWGAIVEPGALVLVAAIAFGLSTDYGIILLSRIREARAHAGSEGAAIAAGLERTGRIVTAAALLFCAAVSGAATSQIMTAKEVALGMMLAVAIDATIVRSLLVPALMAILGRWNWWAPTPLRRRRG
nr:MMPL family transporter [Actinomycetota bacterium]